MFYVDERDMTQAGIEESEERRKKKSSARNNDVWVVLPE
jgi:hypothetical protein